MDILLPYDEASALLREELNKLTFEEVISLKNSEAARDVLESPAVYVLIMTVNNKKLTDLFLEVTGNKLILTPF